jgi:hypothetical protein
MSDRPSAGRGIADAFRNREQRADRSPRQVGARAQAGQKQQRKRAKTGKRSNPSYTQVSALVMKDVNGRFAVAQAQASVEEGRKVERGELINMLMAHFAVGAVTVEELEESLEEIRQG